MSGAQWYKGNIHTHTTESDGDEDPHKVTSWYRRARLRLPRAERSQPPDAAGLRLRPAPLPKAADGAGRGGQRPHTRRRNAGAHQRRGHLADR